MQYRSMFQDNDHMKKILVWIYEDILKFHLRALRVFTQPGTSNISSNSTSLIEGSMATILQRHLERLSGKFQVYIE
jgi:hypothetical protein